MKKSTIGEVVIDFPRNPHIARLRFTVGGKRYSLSKPAESSKLIAAQIKLDIERDEFDILKYKDIKSLSSFYSNKLDINTLYTKWVLEIRNGNLNTNSNYSQVQVMISKWDMDSGDLVHLLSQEKLSYTTYNRRLHTLQEFYKWLVLHKFIKSNPFKEIHSKRKPGTLEKTNRQPLTPSQINKFLERLQGDRFGKYYYNFIYFMFRTGVRNEEGIGLRVKYVDFDKKLIHICEVMARGKQGTNAKYRIRKATKNNKTRFIPIPEDLIKILEPICKRKTPDELVFTGRAGSCIDDRQLLQRIIKPIMHKLKYGDRDLYVARHSFATRAIKQGLPLTVIAELMGNTVKTLVAHYVNVVEQPKILPELYDKKE